MNYKSKFKIKRLKYKKEYCEIGSEILKKRFRILSRLIQNYLNDNSPENLHKLRIAVRRFRYNLELFANCYESKFYDKIYEMGKNVQDTIGEARDLDILSEKINLFAIESKSIVSGKLYDSIKEKRVSMENNINELLKSILSDKLILKNL